MASPLQDEVVDEWWTDLLPGDYFDVDYVEDEVSHERLTLWPLFDGNATWAERSPDDDEWPEDLSCVVPNLGPLRAWPFARIGVRPTGRRKLYAFQARLVYEALHVANLPAREQVTQRVGQNTN